VHDDEEKDGSLRKEERRNEERRHGRHGKAQGVLHEERHGRRRSPKEDDGNVQEDVRRRRDQIQHVHEEDEIRCRCVHEESWCRPGEDANVHEENDDGRRRQTRFWVWFRFRHGQGKEGHDEDVP